MVKNTKGGKGHKKFGRKFTTNNGPQMTRISKHPDELYACCSKIYGPSCDVLCLDGTTKLCIIRNKFKGRNKRDSKLVIGTWLLIGRREFETAKEGKKENCDLLEVYSENDKKFIQQHENDKPWSVFNSIKVSSEKDDEENELGIEFVDNSEMDYYEDLINSNKSDIITGNNVGDDDSNNDSDLDIDDI